MLTLVKPQHSERIGKVYIDFVLWVLSVFLTFVKK
nr:MAG TPA: hypothetical protein [Caudoviricetes sp.]